jgi:hypothetical protein
MPPMSPQEREQFLGEMTERERGVFDRLAAATRRLDTGARFDLRFYWALGRGVGELRAAGAAAKYGGMKRLAGALGCSTSLLAKASDFAARYTEEEARGLTDDGVGWGTLSATLTVRGKREQLAWARRATREGWSLPELRKQIQEAAGGPRHGGGRRRRAPRSYGHAVDVRELRRATGRWLEQSRGVWSAAGGLLGRLAELPEREHTAELLGRIEEAEELVGELAREAAALRRGLRQVLDRMRQSLAARDA